MNEDIRPSASVRKFPIEGGLLLLDAGADCLFAYNDTARYVWELIEAGRVAEDLAPEFAQAWGIALPRAQADLASIVAQWRMQGLLAGSENRAASVGPGSEIVTDEHRAAPIRWASEWTCTIGGTTIAFAAENDLPAPIRLLLRHLETPGARPQAHIEIRSAPSGEAVLVSNGLERVRTSDPAQFVGGVWQTILELIHPEVRWRAIIHGAALAHNGTGLALIGPSGSGKSTLAAGLLGRGFGYRADDIVALSEPDGMIVPWPLPLSIKKGSVDVLKSRYPELARALCYRTKGVEARLLIPPADAWDAEPVRLKALFFPRFTEGAVPKKRKLSSFQALERLLTDRIWLGHPITEERVRSFLAWLDDTPAYAVSYGTLNDGVQLVEHVIP